MDDVKNEKVVGEMEKEKEIPDVKVEIKEIENLKDDIRNNWKLGNEGLAFKIIKHNSPYEATYEKIQGDFFQSVSNALKSTDLKAFVKKARK